MSPHSDDTKQTFLDALAKTGVISHACQAAGIKSRKTAYVWRDEDPLFADAWQEAIESAADSLEMEARRRAIEGVVRVRLLGTGENAKLVDEYQYSDSLLSQLLKAKKPNEYAERTKAEITSPDGSLKPENTTAAAARLLAILEEARQRRTQAEIEEDELFR